jgi:hypothetical protein
MWHACWRREIHAGFRWGNLKARGQVEKLGVYEKIILKWILKKQSGSAWVRSF